MKYIIFGGFDYAVRYEMDQDAVFRGIDYFIDSDPALIGTTYLGKRIYHPAKLLEEKKDEILVLIGSIIYKTELSIQLEALGFEEEKHFIWAIRFTGDANCPRLWKHIEWNDKAANKENLNLIEDSEYTHSRLKVASRLIDIEKFNTVIDLGAANERLREFLPNKICYIPVDYVKYSNETLLCDLNKYKFPVINSNPETTCIFSVENIQYCQDWKWYLQKVYESCVCFIWGHTDFSRISREYRRTHWTGYNALFDYEVIRHLLKLGFVLTDALDFRLKTTCYKFEKKE